MSDPCRGHVLPPVMGNRPIPALHRAAPRPQAVRPPAPRLVRSGIYPSLARRSRRNALFLFEPPAAAPRMGSKFLQMVLKSKLSSAEADSAEVFVPAGILAPDYPANPLAGEFLLRDPLSGDPLSGASLPGDLLPGDLLPGELLPGEPLPGSEVLASGACGTGSASSGFAPSDSVLPNSAPSDFAPSGSAPSGSAPSGPARFASASLSSLSGVTSAVSGPADLPSFERFALGVYPFLELQPFHRAYYRVLEAFAAGRVRAG